MTSARPHPPSHGTQSSAEGPAPVTILMGVLDGQDVLPDQLQSFLGQTGPWRLIASDDGSNDTSPSLLAEFAGAAAAAGGEAETLNGPRQGFASNYLSLIAALPEDPGLVAFSDQDDIWTREKLDRARAALAQYDALEPVLYCAPRWNWTPDKDRKTATRPPLRPTGFANALIENVAFGNTIVLNPAAARIVRIAGMRVSQVFAHDWWMYQLITGAGGRVHFDTVPVVLYRQHDGNVLGASEGLRHQMNSKARVMAGLFAERVAIQCAALLQTPDLLTPSNLNILERFLAARDASNALARLRRMRQVGVYRQTGLGTLGFWGALALGKV